MNVAVHTSLPLPLDTSALVLVAGLLAVAAVCYDVYRRGVLG